MKNQMCFDTSQFDKSTKLECIDFRLVAIEEFV